MDGAPGQGMVGAERHDTIDMALAFPGAAAARTVVAADDQGRMY